MSEQNKDAELLPCPFCGDVPQLPSGDGTQYEIECGGCGQAMASVQICDLMTIEERAEESFSNYRYQEQYVERARIEATKRWNERASLPVGVPDANALRRSISHYEAALQAAFPSGAPGHVSLQWNEARRQSAAPTVKAEQVDCLYCQGHGDVTRISGQTAEYNEECPECKGTGLAPSLPAAGSADIPEPDFALDGGSQPCYYAETVQRIVAALSAHQSAHVSVPRELLQDLRDLASEAVDHHRQAFAGYKLERQANMDQVIANADALLNGGEA